MKIRAVPRRHAVGPILGIVLGDIDPARHNVWRAHPVDAAAFWHRGARLDQASAWVDPITRIDMIVIGAICQGKTKGSPSQNWRKPSPRRACSTPHHPPSRGGNYRIRAWSDCGENRQAGPPL